MSLVICVPTYNRATYLDKWISEHIHLTVEYDVKLKIIDNCSTDGTEDLVRDWAERSKAIIYTRNLENIGAIRNALRTLEEDMADYIWPVGDTYLINADMVREVIEESDVDGGGADLIVFNLAGICTKPSMVYKSNERVLLDLAGVMSCLATTVYSRRLIGRVALEQFEGTYFPHTNFAFYHIALQNVYLKWVSNLSVEDLSAAVEYKKNWRSTDQVLNIGSESWANMILSLPSNFNLKIKLAALRKFSEFTRLYSFRSMLGMRESGAVSFCSTINSRYHLRLTGGDWVIVKMLCVCLIPRLVVGCLRLIHGFMVKKGH